jgi:ketosteroid isomerase-like protein
MSQDNVEIVRASFEAWNAGDVDALRASFEAWNVGDVDALRELYDPNVILQGEGVFVP